MSEISSSDKDWCETCNRERGGSKIERGMSQLNHRVLEKSELRHTNRAVQ